MYELTQLPTLTWDDIEPCLGDVVRRALESVLRIKDGGVLTDEQLRALAYAEGDDLLGLLVAANELRREIAGDVITYVINRNINFTNVCFIGCKYCAYCCQPGAPHAYFLTPEEIAKRALEAAELGATEVCIQGGLRHDMPRFYYCDVLRAVKSAVPDMHTHAFSPMEITYGANLTGMSLRDYVLMLKDAGMDSLCGTAAEILDDEVREVLSRNKVMTNQWREVIVTAHECGIQSSSTMMYGHIETPDHWLKHLQIVREIQSHTGGFTEFVPLGFIHTNTLLFRQGLARPGASTVEHLKVHALARVVLAGSIRNIQASWVKMDRSVSQLCLQAGANDYGGTLMEESISRLAGATSGEYLPVEEFQARIRELGRVPAQRDTTYQRLHFVSDLSSREVAGKQMV